MLTKILSKDSTLFFAIASSVGILILSLINKVPSPAGLTINDKLGHTIAYLCLGFFWLTFAKHHTKKRVSFFLIALACIVYGIIIELMQGALTSTRTASVLDVIANTSGVIIACFIVFGVKIGVKK